MYARSYMHFQKYNFLTFEKKQKNNENPTTQCALGSKQESSGAPNKQLVSEWSHQISGSILPHSQPARQKQIQDQSNQSGLYLNLAKHAVESPSLQRNASHGQSLPLTNKRHNAWRTCMQSQSTHGPLIHVEPTVLREQVLGIGGEEPHGWRTLRSRN